MPAFLSTFFENSESYKSLNTEIACDHVVCLESRKTVWHPFLPEDEYNSKSRVIFSSGEWHEMIELFIPETVSFFSPRLSILGALAKRTSSSKQTEVGNWAYFSRNQICTKSTQGHRNLSDTKKDGCFRRLGHSKRVQLWATRESVWRSGPRLRAVRVSHGTSQH